MAGFESSLSSTIKNDIVISNNRQRSSVSTNYGKTTANGNNATPGTAQLTVRQSIVPLVLATVLLCIFSFSHGLTDVLNKRFQGALHLSKVKSTGLQVAYFGCVVSST